MEPNGSLKTINLRALQSSGLRTAIATAYQLDSAKSVKQFAHWIMIGPHFFESINTQDAIAGLPEYAVVVWTKVRRLWRLRGTHCTVALQIQVIHEAGGRTLITDSLCHVQAAQRSLSTLCKCMFRLRTVLIS